ncbi:MAG: adenylyltransferase/cytidyltransferase family protein [Chloroflexi bacterium]|nr:adenylyltransferase/cytidyltransferase family protein [Chloroflexota bacterium]
MITIIAVGGFDNLCSRHVRFLEKASKLGDLHVLLWSDDLVRRATGQPPKFPQAERRYLVEAIRYVKQALISTGWGWLDAEPEIARLRPDIYLVKEDGDRSEKRAFCAGHGLEYVGLRRIPKQGLPRRSSTDLRGF